MKGCLNVFDIDDTLFKTHGVIKVIKNGEVIRELSNHEFGTYKLQDGEMFDYSIYRDAHHFRKTGEPMHSLLNHAKDIISTQCEKSTTILLTARGDLDCMETFLQKFRDHDFPIDDVHVERAGNLDKINPMASSAAAKMFILRRYIRSGKYNRIRVYDDSEKNLKGILKLVKLHPEIEVEAYRVYKDGTFEKYHLNK